MDRQIKDFRVAWEVTRKHLQKLSCSLRIRAKHRAAYTCDAALAFEIFVTSTHLATGQDSPSQDRDCFPASICTREPQSLPDLGANIGFGSASLRLGDAKTHEHNQREKISARQKRPTHKKKAGVAWTPASIIPRQ
jgi:hypothetical protein